jgi:hypothetical protein
MAVSIVAFLDGGSHALFKGDHYLPRYKELVAKGFQGKRLVDELIQQSWEPRPIAVTIADSNGVVAAIKYE